MLRLRLLLPVGALLLAGTVHAQTSNDFATGNMHFDAKDMDANGDHMITRDEMMQYGEKLWTMMANGKDTIPIAAAAKDFATGGINFSARAIDTDHDGSITKDEFTAYTGKKFDKMKNADGMVSVQDAGKAFARGNTHAGKTESPAASPSK